MLNPSDSVTGSDGSSSADLLNLAEAMQALADRSTTEEGLPALRDLVHLAVERIGPADSASITMFRGGKFATEAATDDVATRADTLQYEIGFGPCVDAVLDDSVYVSGDVAKDERWLEWGRRVHLDVGVRSVLSQRLQLGPESSVIAGLNIYSSAAEAFGNTARAMGLVLATHGGLVVTTMLATDRARQLMSALKSNREIGMAMGVLMHEYRLTRTQAFDVLRAASQDSNRKVVDVALEVVDTGSLSVRGWPTAQLNKLGGAHR